MRKKTEPVHAVALVLVAAFSLTLAGACSRSPRRSDWRSPPPPASSVCTSDADCPGGACAIELGASQGSCGPASPLRPAGDAGAPGAPGAPSRPTIQPSPGDIQI